MRALVKTECGAELKERPEPSLVGPDAVKIAVHRAAICRTDWYAAQGRICVERGRILGHEFAGVVESVGGSVKRVKPGDRVMVNPFLACGHCPDCLARRPHLCPDGGFLGITHDGAFADWVVVPDSQVYTMPEGMSFERAAFAEPLAATMAILGAGLAPRDSIAVVGRGRIAQLTRLVLCDHGFSEVSLRESATDNDSFDAIIEAGIDSGNVLPILAMLRPGGTLVLKSRSPGLLALPTLELIRKRITIRAVHYAPFELAIRYLRGGAPELAQFVGRAWPLEDYDKAFNDARSEETKVYFALRD